jgi:ubiquinone/menaquinone biosynthesis C-methylase UbiE
MDSPTNPWQQFHDLEASDYDQLCFTQNTAAEIDFMVDLLDLSPGASLLDLGCGTGRHAVELARLGFSVTGLDLSSEMLSLAREKAAAARVELTLVHANAADFVLDQQFDAVICICEGSFGLLSSTDDPTEQPLAILRNVTRSLRPGGQALFTVLNAFKMIREHSAEDIAAGRFNPLTLTTVTEYSPGDGLPPLPLRERAFTPTELATLFPLAGLHVQGLWGGTAGNWGRRPVELDEFEIMVLAQKPTE